MDNKMSKNQRKKLKKQKAAQDDNLIDPDDNKS